MGPKVTAWTRFALGLTGMLLCLLSWPCAGRGQDAPAMGQAGVLSETLPQPRPVQTPGPRLDKVGICKDMAVMPITLPTALQLAQTNNLDIAQARQVIAQAQAALERARTALSHPIMFDGRNLFDPAEMEQLGFIYKSIGR